MGWSAREVRDASLWEFFSAWNGYVEANSPRQKGVQTEQEADDLFDRLSRRASGSERLSTLIYTLDEGRLVPAGEVTFVVQ